jgi:hypothetical protein
MKLSEAKRILKENGFRILKESDGYTFRIAGGKVNTHVKGGRYGDKTLKYEEKQADDVLGADTLDREYTDVNDLERKVIEDICGGDLAKIESAHVGVMHHLDKDNAATLYISVSFTSTQGMRSKFKNRVSVHANLIITGGSGAGSIDSDDLATVLKSQLDARNGEFKALRGSQEFESYKGKGRLLKESSYYTISLPVVKINVGGRDYFANGVTATGELTAGCGSRGEDEFEIDPTSVEPEVSYWTVGDSEVGETEDMVLELCDVLAGLEGWEEPDTDEYHI